MTTQLEHWFHHSVSLPWQWEMQSSQWSSSQQCQHDSRQTPSLEDGNMLTSIRSKSQQLMQDQRKASRPSRQSKSKQQLNQWDQSSSSQWTSQHHHQWQDPPTTTTKWYLLKQYVDILEGIRTFYREYHTKLKEDNKPVQHPLWQFAVSLNPAYRAELDGLLKIGIVTKRVHWNGSTQLSSSCEEMGLVLWGYAWIQRISTKTLSRHQWYSKTIDDIPLNLPGSTLFT